MPFIAETNVLMEELDLYSHSNSVEQKLNQK